MAHQKQNQLILHQSISNMKSLFNHKESKEIIQRINQLKPASKAEWGKMNVAQMVAHAQTPLKVAFGEIKLKRGLIGILFGFTLSQIIAKAAGWSTVVTTSSIVVAFGVSCGIGLAFGIYPAVQAAKLDPIEAIRYE